MEDSREDGSMPFLDTLVTPCSDGSLSTRVYRKPTHTDLYLQWDSHHTIAAKYSVVRTLHHREKLYVQPSSYWMKKNIIYKRSWKRTSTPAGPLIGWKTRSRHPQNKIQKEENIPVTLEARTNSTWSYHMWEVWARAWRTYATNTGYRCTTKEAIQSKASWWLPKVKITSQWKVASFTDSNAKGWTVMMSI